MIKQIACFPVYFRIKNKEFRTPLYGLVFVLLAICLQIVLVIPHAILIGDGAARYDPLARNLLLGNGFSSSLSAPFVPNDYDVPGYPIFLAAIYALAGRSQQTVVVVQTVVGVLTLLIMVRLAKLLSLPDQVTKLSLVIGLLCPFLWVFSATVLAEVVAAFMITLLTCSCAKIVQEPSAKQVRWWFYAGLVGGACLLVRTDLITSVTLLILSSLAIILVKGSTWKRAALGWVVFSTALVLTLLPWTIRNYFVFGDIRIPGLIQVTHVFESDYASYYSWLGTWVDDPRLIHSYVWDKYGDPNAARQFPVGKIPETDRLLAESTWSVARQNNSFDGLPAAQFAALTVKAYESDPIGTRIVVPLRRLVLAWFFVPDYLDLLETPPLLRSIAQVAGLVLFLCALVGAVYGLVVRRMLGIFLLGAMIISRSISPLIALVGSEPRYMVVALPAVFILVALGIFALQSVFSAVLYHFRPVTLRTQTETGIQHPVLHNE